MFFEYYSSIPNWFSKKYADLKICAFHRELCVIQLQIEYRNGNGLKGLMWMSHSMRMDEPVGKIASLLLDADYNRIKV